MAFLPMDPSQMPSDVSLPPVSPMAGLPSNPVSLPQMQQPQPGGGMFGANSPLRGVAGAIGDMLMQRAGGSPMYLPMMMAQRNMTRQMQMAKFQSDLEYQNAMRMMPIQYSMRMMSSPFALQEAQAGIPYGSPQYMKDAQAYHLNQLDPPVATQQGEMLTSTVRAMTAAGQPAPPNVTFTPVQQPTQGGQTQPASDPFLGPFAPIDGYNRY